jgi:hypothetical protein
LEEFFGRFGERRRTAPTAEESDDEQPSHGPRLKGDRSSPRRAEGGVSPRPAPAPGRLGVQVQQVTEEIADALGMREARGALVAGVIDGGPAKPGGIRIGDVIVGFDGHDIEEVDDLPRLVAGTPVGKDVQVVVIRKGNEKTMTVKVGRAIENAPAFSAQRPTTRTPSSDVTRDERRRLYYGTIGHLGQHREHEMTTRTALDCYPNPENEAFAKDGLCFQPNSLDEIAGRGGTFGAVGGPDNLYNREYDDSEKHCDNSELKECRDYMNAQMDAAVLAAHDLLCWPNKTRLGSSDYDCPDGLLDEDELLGTHSPTALSCTFTRAQGSAKCNVLEHLGSVLHAVQDFYSHSNWVDESDPKRPLSPSNPPGLNQRRPAPFLNIRPSNTDTAIPKGLISGCFIRANSTDLVGNSRCGTAPSHEDLNKDEGIIDPRLFNQPGDPTLTSASTTRGKIGTNFHRSVEAAVLDTRDKIQIFRERLIETYGDQKGTLLFCAITNDDPIKTCYGKWGK